MDNRRIVVVGSGIAALSTIFELNKNGFNNILCLSSEDFAPSCSRTSTGINTLRGTESGLSPLGDILIASHEAFHLFNNTYKPSGVTKAQEVHCWIGENSKLKRRYKVFSESQSFDFFQDKLSQKVNFTDNEAYIISPELLLNWFKSEASFDFKQDFIISVDKGESTIYGLNSSYHFDHLILCSGFFAKKHIDLVDDEKIKKNLFYSKSVSGAYLEFDSQNFISSNLNLDKSFSFVFEDTHLIYREDVKKVIIGSTSENNKLNFLPNKELLKNKFKKLQDLIGGDFPNIEAGVCYTGVRHKTQNREPFWGRLQPNISAIWGFYKTGWSMAFLASKEVVLEIKKNSN